MDVTIILYCRVNDTNVQPFLSKRKQFLSISLKIDNSSFHIEIKILTNVY